MLPLKYIPLVFKYIIRYRLRTALTLSGVASAMFLFFAVDAMQQGVHAATSKSAEDAILVVYREDRFCPFTSQLPEDYQRRIASIPGVRTVIPMKVMVNNCRASLDVITFRGVPPEAFDSDVFDSARIVEGSLDEWKRRGDAALVGSRLASRRGWQIGDRASIGNVAVTIAGIFESDEPQDQNVAYTNLEFIQRAHNNADGIVTQFTVLVEDPGQLDEIATAIDAEFAIAQAPTTTWTEKEFVARAVTDILEIVAFASWLGWGALAAVFALVANTIVLSVQDRVRDHAILQTLGYTHGLIARLIVAESVMLSVLGGIIGIAAGYAVISAGRFSFSVEGLSVNIQAETTSLIVGMLVCVAIGVLAGLFPAWQVSRRATAESFRAV